MSVIAMTREMGTRGKDVAINLADRLGVELVHHELVEAPFDRRTAPERSEVHRFLHGAAPNDKPCHSTSSINGFMTAEEVLTLARRGNVIIRGWGAARLLKSIPHVLCVRICAPLKNRIGEMMKRLGVDEDFAHREIDRSDTSHTTAFARFFGADWRDSQNYDLVLNTGQLTPEVCADILIDAVKSPVFHETETSRRRLDDRLAEARIKSVLRTDDRIKLRASDIYVSVSDGVVNLYGAARDRSAAGDIESAIRTKVGCEMIQNTIQTVGALLRSSG